MKSGLRGIVLLLALATGGVMAVSDAQAATQYPINSTAYRKKMGTLIQRIRTTCSARCPREAVPGIMAALTKVEFRITQVCADGWVTAAEDDYVLSVVPDLPKRR